MTPAETSAPPGTDAPAILLAYQQALLASTAMVRLVEKSRRIGISWTEASEAAPLAAADETAGGADVLYIGYNLEMAREFIDDSAFWARHLAGFAAVVDAFDYDDVFEGNETRAIKAFRISFASGFEIVALSSRPRSLRGKQGLIIIDEAAFHDDLPGLMKAALATLIWGGRVIVISTHDGDDNPFNDLIQEVKERRKPYELHRITFDQALTQGLYERIWLKLGREWSPEAEAEWAAEIREFYGDDAEEELDCIPARGSGVFLTRAIVEACMNPHYPVVRLALEQGFELKPEAERAAFVEAWLEENVDPLLACLDPGFRSFIGEDFGRSGDLTVLAPGQETKDLTLRVPFTIELRNCPFRQQEQIFFHVVDRLPRFMAGALDARGNGQWLAELAAQRYGAGRIAQVMLSLAWYLEHMPPFKAAFEDRGVELPRDSETLGDLRSIRVEKGVAKVPDSARTRGPGKEQRHGDAAIALALLHYASRMEVAPIEFQTLGLERPSMRAGDDELSAAPAVRPERGFGAVGGGPDLAGF